jgi:hypothetical protein
VIVIGLGMIGIQCYRFGIVCDGTVMVAVDPVSDTAIVIGIGTPRWI